MRERTLDCHSPPPHALKGADTLEPADGGPPYGEDVSVQQQQCGETVKLGRAYHRKRLRGACSLHAAKAHCWILRLRAMRGGDGAYVLRRGTPVARIGGRGGFRLSTPELRDQKKRSPYQAN